MLETQKVSGSSPLPPTAISDESIGTCPSLSIYLTPPIWREIGPSATQALIFSDLLLLSILSISLCMTDYHSRTT
jgi:hypothetical protein